MKKTLLMLSVFASATLMAQNKFSATNEVDNGTYSYYVSDSNASDLGTVTGNNVTWDYTNLAQYAGQTKNIVVDASSASSYATDFPTSNKYVNIESLTQDFLKTDATGRQRVGIVVSDPTTGDVIAKFDSPISLMNYDFSLNDQISLPFSGSADAPTFGMTGMAFTGTHYTDYDGFGTLKVGTTTVPNVSRIHYNDTMSINTGTLGMMDVYLSQYEYYDLDNSKEPVFIYTSGWVGQQGSSTPMMSFNVVLSKYQTNQNVATTNLSNINLTVSPNPVKDQFKLDGNFDNASVQIIDGTGKVVYQGNVNNGSNISTADLKSGIYMVKATIDQKTITKKIVKL